MAVRHHRVGFTCLWLLFAWTGLPLIALAAPQVTTEVAAGHARFEFLTPSLVRMEYSPSSRFVDAPTAVVVKRKWPQVHVIRKTESGWLVLDTGAGQTMISKRIANDLRLYSTGAGTRIGVGGAVSVPTATLDAVRVGDADVKNMRVSIHDLPFNAFEEGLLGMDFLGRFQMSLDIEKRVLILSPRKS